MLLLRERPCSAASWRQSPACLCCWAATCSCLPLHHGWPTCLKKNKSRLLKRTNHQQQSDTFTGSKAETNYEALFLLLIIITPPLHKMHFLQFHCNTLSRRSKTPRDLVWDIPCRLASGVRSWMSKRPTTSLLTPCSTRLQDWACFVAPYSSPTGATSQMAPPAITSLFWHTFISQIAAVPSTRAVKVESHAWQVTSDRQASDTQVQKRCQIFLRDSNAAIKSRGSEDRKK